MADYVNRETRWGSLKVALAILMFLFLVLLYGPTIVMMILSFQGPNGGPTFPLNGVSLAWYQRLLNPDGGPVSTGEYMGSLGAPALRSLGLGILTATISTVMAVMAAQAFRTSFRGSRLVFNIYILGIVIPGVALGLGHALFWQFFKVEKHWFSTALLAHVVWTFPFCFLIVLAVFNRFDRTIEQAAMCLGANPWTTFRRITLPALKPGIISSVLFGFTLSFDEIARTVLVVGSSNTLPLEILGATTVRVTPRLYAMGVVTTVLSLVVVGIAGWVLTSELRRSRFAGQEEV